jgi:hypothetical protein
MSRKTAINNAIIPRHGLMILETALFPVLLQQTTSNLIMWVLGNRRYYSFI